MLAWLVLAALMPSAGWGLMDNGQGSVFWGGTAILNDVPNSVKNMLNILAKMYSIIQSYKCGVVPLGS